VQALKRHYIGYYKAYLAHLPALATSLHKSEHPLVLNIPDKRTKRAPATPSQSKPNTSAQSPHGTEEGPAASDSKVMSQNKPSGDTLATFSDAEEDAVEAAMATTAAVSRGADTNSPFLVAWQQALPASLAGLGGHERVAAIAAAVDMDERSACAVLCGQRKRFYVHQTVALLGRESKSKGEVCPAFLTNNNAVFTRCCEAIWPLISASDHCIFGLTRCVAIKLTQAASLEYQIFVSERFGSTREGFT
jgi:hypothetical protein